MAEQQGLKCKPKQKFLPNQRKRSMVTLETKMEIVCALQKGNSERVVAERFGVARSTVGDIWKYRQKIEDCISSSESLVYAKKRCVVREPKFELVDSACWKWFCQQRAKGAPVTCSSDEARIPQPNTVNYIFFKNRLGSFQFSCTYNVDVRCYSVYAIINYVLCMLIKRIN